MLVECQKRGIVGNLTNMYDLYFSNKENNATIVPYMEGDYFPAEVENIIKDIEEGKVGKKSNGKEGKKKKGDKKQKRKSGRGGTRSSGIDEDALKASGIQFPGKDQKSLEEGGRDFVMGKLGETIQPMKESFIVAHLAWKGAKKEDMVVPKAILEYREKHNVVVEDGPEENYIEPELEKDKTSDTEVRCKVVPNQGFCREVTPSNSTSKENVAVKVEDTDMKDADNSMDNGSKDPKDTNFPDAKDEAIKKDSKHTNNENTTDATIPKEAIPKDIVKSEDVDKKETDGSEDVIMKDSTATTVAESDKAHTSQNDAKNGQKTQELTKKEENRIEGQVQPSKNDPLPDSTSQSKKRDSQDVASTNVQSENESAGKRKPKENVKNNGFEKKSDQTGFTDGGQKAETSGIPTSSGIKSGQVSTSSVASTETKSATSFEKSETPKSTLSMQERSGKFAAMAKKRGFSGDEKSETEDKEGKDKTKAKGKTAQAAPVVYVLDSKGRRVKVIDDDAEEMDCEFLNNRQAFLNLCQGNHYQFDHLRRAKHSSMMVLWHLHNRDAPKFVQQCTTCSREILQGYRYHCPICADFDQCQDCVHNPNTPTHPHKLKPIAVSGQQTELTEAQRKERQRSIQLHMTLLQHAATCNSPKCPSANCTKMKGLLKHGGQCQIKATGGCNVCKRIWALLQIHARQCKASQCPVPNCMAIRERVRQLKKQQQAMDDRRRQEMNRVYRGAR